MRQLLLCRRTFIAAMSIGCLAWLSHSTGTDYATQIASIAGMIAAANAAEKAIKSK